MNNLFLLRNSTIKIHRALCLKGGVPDAYMGRGMSDDLASTLTVAKLKALCVLNDLVTSGKKSDLLQRLLDSGLGREEFLDFINSVNQDVAKDFK